MTRCTAQPSWNVAAVPVAGRPSSTATRSRMSRTNERAHMLFGVVRSHSSSVALASASGAPGRPQHQLQVQQGTDRPLAQQPQRRDAVRLVAQLVVDAREARAALRHLDHAGRLARVERHGLLAQHVLPRFERRDRLARVAVGGGRDQHQIYVARAGQLFPAAEGVRDSELGGDRAGALHAATRDCRDRHSRHEAQRRELDPAGEPGADDPDAHAHSWERHETVSTPTGTASNVASTAMRVAVRVSPPVPRATSATTLSARVTQTVPLSSGAPRAASASMKRTPTVAPRGVSVSPRCSNGHVPIVSESAVRSHTTTPLPPFTPWSRMPPRICPWGPLQRNARTGASIRTVSLPCRVRITWTRGSWRGGRHQAVPSTLRASAAAPRPFRRVPPSPCRAATARPAERGRP